MIYVSAFVKTKPGMVPQALELYRVLVPKVLANEPGCLEYVPTTDFDLGLCNQNKDVDLIVVAERWKTIEDFKSHLNMQHSIEFRSGIQRYLDERITLKITHGAI